MKLPFCLLSRSSEATHLKVCESQAVELLLRGTDLTDRERQLIRAVPEMEIINALVSNIKISMPGLAQLKTNARRSKKAARSSGTA